MELALARLLAACMFSKILPPHLKVTSHCQQAQIPPWARLLTGLQSDLWDSLFSLTALAMICCFTLPSPRDCDQPEPLLCHRLAHIPLAAVVGVLNLVVRRNRIKLFKISVWNAFMDPGRTWLFYDIFNMTWNWVSSQMVEGRNPRFIP